MGRRARTIGSTDGRAVRHDLYLEIYRAAVSLVVGETLADAWALARAAWPTIDETHDDGADACVLDLDDRAVVLLARGADADVLAHEAVHVAAWILQARGMPFSFKNEEGVAYLVQWFVHHASPLLAQLTPPSSP